MKFNSRNDAKPNRAYAKRVDSQSPGYRKSHGIPFSCGAYDACNFMVSLLPSLASPAISPLLTSGRR